MPDCPRVPTTCVGGVELKRDFSNKQACNARAAVAEMVGVGENRR
jgi:hypothetical protein